VLQGGGSGLGLLFDGSTVPNEKSARLAARAVAISGSQLILAASYAFGAPASNDGLAPAVRAEICFAGFRAPRPLACMLDPIARIGIGRPLLLPTRLPFEPCGWFGADVRFSGTHWIRASTLSGDVAAASA
jgi:hypothetical protein